MDGQPDTTTEIEDRQGATLGHIHRKRLAREPGQQATLQHRSLPDTVHADAGQRSRKEVGAVAHRVDLVAVDVLEGLTDRQAVRVAQPELG
ncbi:MAG: hypothetical protein ACQERF_09615 [Actinomycetota bacterium]